MRRLSDIDRAELALGLLCVAIRKDSGEGSIRCGTDYLADEDAFEYFGRHDLEEQSDLPTDYRQLAAGDVSVVQLSAMVLNGVVDYADFWFPTKIFTRED